MKLFSEACKFDYPLTPDSVVMDVGAHIGNFTGIIHERYGCTVHAFEPVPDFYNRCVAHFHDNPKIRLWPLGLGAKDGAVKIGVKGEMSGEYCSDPNSTEQVPIRDVADFIISHEISRIGLMSINCEGAEYAILERLLDAGLIDRFDAISVQFHTTAPDYQHRYDTIRAKLFHTHQLDYDAPFCWSGFSIRR